jgi:3D-(3,5/4)-trihydroxycyclohexane-1,2-dione acylhydrolase (decyclizing)
MQTIRLTMAQALVRYLAAQRTIDGGREAPLVAGVWAIFGHGNVAGLGEALWHHRAKLPTLRAHNEQAMAHAAIAFAKASRRRRAMACTSSIGPGASNMVTAAAVAHVNRLPVLFLPGDVFASRRPDPVLQQLEAFGDPTLSVNDCFRPVSRYFDRILRPEQILTALPRAIQTMTDPAACGPATLALCQDVQCEAHDYPVSFFEPRLWVPRRARPDRAELAAAAAAIRGAERPFIIAGGGVLYAEAEQALSDFASAFGIPVAETQAGKSALPHDHALNLGALGVTGTSAANELAAQADLILAVGTRLQDFTTGSWALFQQPSRRILALNLQPFDVGKHAAVPLVADARAGLEALAGELRGWSAPSAWPQAAAQAKARWLRERDEAVAPIASGLPTDAQVIGAVQRAGRPTDIVVCAAGGLPGELHKLWHASRPGGYHLEYGYSCMGYEIAGGLGVKMARPDAEVIVLVGDGSYLMLNSEIATSVLLGRKLIVVVLDNRGFGCIDRLQRATGGASFNNLIHDTTQEAVPAIDLAAHAASLGAEALRVGSLAELEAGIARAREARRTTVLVIETDPAAATAAGGHWWDVAVPQVSERQEVREAHAAYVKAAKAQRPFD